MKANTRRKFLTKTTGSLTGALVFPGISFSKNEKGRHSTLPSIEGAPTEEYWEEVKKQFKFSKNLNYFNNASLGACPIPVQEATKEFQDTLDGFPSKYMWGGWNEQKEETRQKVAKLFSVSEEEIALIHNTTEGMNLIARSFNLKPGDEVILDNHEHASGTICWEVWQEELGIKLVRPVLPILPGTVEEVVDVFRKAITPNTKVISMCHIVNTNGMILPVKEVSEMAHEKGVRVAVDGAQSAGMFNVDLGDLGCDFFTASAHKWLFSPKGVGIFYSRLESQYLLKPLMVARGHKDKSIRRLENYNTRNLPEVLGLGSSIDFINEIGIDRIDERTYELKEYFRSKVDSNPKFRLKSPEPHDLSGAIQALEVVGKDVADVRNQLLDQYNIDCRPMSGFDLNALRLSFAIFITKSDIDYLVKSLEEIAS